MTAILAANRNRIIAPAYPTTNLAFRHTPSNRLTVFSDNGVTPVVSNGDVVQQMNDIIGGQHQRQATLGNKPTFVTNQGAKLVSGLQFAGAKFTKSITNFTTTLQNTYYMVLKIGTPGGSGPVIWSMIPSSSANEYIYRDVAGTASDAITVFRGTARTIPGVVGQYPLNVWGILCIVIDASLGASSYVRSYWDDMVTPKVSNTNNYGSASQTAALYLNTYTNLGSFGDNFTMLDFGVFTNTAHDATQRAAVKTVLQALYFLPRHNLSDGNPTVYAVRSGY